jgi:hypothetical protein
MPGARLEAEALCFDLGEGPSEQPDSSIKDCGPFILEINKEAPRP